MLLTEAILAIARAHPARVALQWHTARWTYADLENAAAHVAARLRASGVERGDRVGLLMRNSPQYVASLLGTFMAGGVAVALNSQERAEVLARQITHSGARAVIGDSGHNEWAALATKLASRVNNPPHLVVATTSDSESALAEFQVALQSGLSRVVASAGATAEQTTRAGDAALMIYTSGTTGRPKAVMLGHGNLTANARAIAEYLGLSAEDRGFCVLPFQFSYGNSVLTSHLLVGAAVIIEDNLAFPQRTLQRMSELRATGFAGVPSTFSLLLTRCRISDYDFSALRYVTQAGGAMTRPAIVRLREELPKARIFVMYGQTEATARISYLPPERLEEKLGSVGIPVANTQVEVCDAQGNILPAGVIGEIRVRGPGIMLGYWQDEAATREVVRDGWLCTGDLGHKDEDGFLFIDGRAVEMIKVGAFRVSPYEVEEEISQIDGVDEVAVSPVPDEVLGQAVKAVIVLRAGASIDALAVKAHCRSKLAAYKIPKVVEFATSLPRTATGKVQRLRIG